MSEDAIPALVDDDRRGGKMLVSKNLGLGEQIQQCNVYLERLLNGVDDMRSMPPMTRAGAEVTHPKIFDRLSEIHRVVHGMYEARREQAMRTEPHGSGSPPSGIPSNSAVER
jgi:hypothetical protein